MTIRLTSHFKQRLILSCLGVIVLALVIYFSYTPLFRPFFILFSIACLNFALWEYYHLAQAKGFRPLVPLGLTCTTLYVVAVYLSTVYLHLQVLLPAFVLLGSMIACFVSFFEGKPAPLANLAITFFGILYLIVPLTCGLQINYLSSEFPIDGRIWLAYVLTTTKMTDVGGYFLGKAFGKHKLAPSLSPKKTIEGAAGGLLFSIIASVLFHLYFGQNPSFHLQLWPSIFLGILLSLAAQFGDLAESLLKRDAGVKDSNHLPGLGGMLDIVDSLVFTLPLMYLILKMQLIS